MPVLCVLWRACRRLMGAGREFYVAYDPTVAESDDTDPQDVLEMGFRVLFGLD